MYHEVDVQRSAINEYELKDSVVTSKLWLSSLTNVNKDQLMSNDDWEGSIEIYRSI